MVSARENVRASIRALGGHLWYSDQSTDWFTVPESVESDLYDLRPSLPFYSTLGELGKPGGFRIHYDQPRADALDCIRRALSAIPDTPENAESISILRSAL